MQNQNPMKTRTQTEVLDWIKKFLPELVPLAEADRHWIWLAADLRGDDKKLTRDLLKEFGFQFKLKGEHSLPSGRMARWAHHCEHPIGKRPSGSGNGGGRPAPTPRNEEPLQRPDFTINRNNNSALETAVRAELEAAIRAELGL